MDAVTDAICEFIMGSGLAPETAKQLATAIRFAMPDKDVPGDEREEFLKTICDELVPDHKNRIDSTGDSQSIPLKEIIKAGLIAKGLGGLYCEDGDGCGCGVDDLMPCGLLDDNDCESAKKGTDGDYHPSEPEFDA